MCNLIIKKMNIDNIKLNCLHSHYTIGYYNDYIELTTIPIVLNKINIRQNRGYYIDIYDETTIQQIKDIDDYLSSIIPNYKHLLHKDETYFIYFKQNEYVKHFLDTFQGDQIMVNIIKLKKLASHTFPIVYIL